MFIVNNPNIPKLSTYHENSLAKRKVLEGRNCCEIEKREDITQLTRTVPFLYICEYLVKNFGKIVFFAEIIGIFAAYTALNE